MQKFRLSLLVVSLGVAACSSSNDNDDTSSPSSPTANVASTTTAGNSNTNNSSSSNSTASNSSNNASNTTNNSVSNTSSNSVSNSSSNNASNTSNTSVTHNSSITGVAYKFSSGSAANKIANAQLISLSSTNKDVLVVDSRTIQLAPLQPGYTLRKDSNGVVMSQGAYSNGTDYMPNTQFGIYQDPNSNQTYLFTQGIITPESNMPTSGEATYYGLATYHITNDTLNKDRSDYDIYGANLTANFASKTLKGELVTTGRPNVTIDTKISGSSFNSDANSDTQVKGNFYGEKAEELGGVYVNEKDGYAGAFSARKW